MKKSRFKWQEEKESDEPPWLYDGSSLMRNGQEEAAARKRAGRRRMTIGLAVLAAVVLFLLLFRFEDVVRAGGEVEPLNILYIKAPLTGTIDQLPFSEGQEIKQGQLLVSIWPEELDIFRDVENKRYEFENANREFQKENERLVMLAVKYERLKREKAIFEGDDSEVRVLQERIQAAGVTLDQRSKDEKRSKNLFQQGVVSAAEYENVLANLELSRSVYAEAGARLHALKNERAIRIEQLTRDIEMTEKELSVSRISSGQWEAEQVQKSSMLEAASKRAELMLITAPSDGQIVRQEKKLGDRVGNGDLIFVLSTGRERRLSVRIDPVDSLRVEVGQPVRVYSSLFSRRYGYASGRVIELGTYARSQSGPGLQTYIPAKVAVDQPPFPLLLGTRVEVQILTGRKRTLLSRRPSGRGGK
ncbi:MAG TPA: HlyD family efflux transporter periplasmic adaptor subunit [bacterium]|uniref:Multidrug resistance protein MdtN n=1 Tax=candidate division TA06 bacterium ADurb.Bin417 TaxID=1852828 RepID=A0A1V5MJ95_UNCT6|nr:MAG: multidrug resistance protein MdtN [candidate division TA06 bacterium ADurb.Bin417]HNQ34704.1 HlyD family efflux transporter periplasmic adaptor subunit [bacterium]HNS49191.1 HlyD family efflux transporter periplasmic adaptor subunit [bacterium]